MENVIGILGFALIAGLMLSPFLAIAWLSRRKPRVVAAIDAAVVQPREKSNYGAGILGGLAILGALWWWFSQPRFSDSDIDDAKASIRENFQKKGFDVSTLTLIRVSDRRLEGFVTLQSAATGPEAFTKECSATLGEGGHYFWRCK